MQARLILCSAFLAACSTQPVQESAAPERMTYTLHCQKSWNDCYTQARSRCGSGDFEELDRHGSATLGTDTRMAVPTNVGREQAAVNMVDRTITIRCN